MRRPFLQVMPRKNDPFVTFYVAHIVTIIAILWKIGVREADIPDIAQHVLLKVHQNWETLSKKPVESWLETICRQQAAEHYRLHRNHCELPEANVGEGVVAETDAHADLERHEIDQIVRRVLAMMDPKQRDMLVRHEFEDESLQSIADAHGIARNTAHARLDKAKEIFRLRAERMLGEKSTRTLLVPFGTETTVANLHVSPEFVDGVHRRVWGNLARELGYDPSDPPALPVHHSENETPKSGARRIRVELPASPKSLLKALGGPLILLGTAGLGALGGILLWPHDSPAIARHTPAVFGPVVVQYHNEVDAGATSSAPPSTSSSVTRTVTAKPTYSHAPTAPELERELSDLERARKLLAQGQHAEALKALEQHARDFPRSDLAAIRQRYMTLAQEGIRKSSAPKD
jgi:RNA polymerase sigma factor (sigma-70 family)